MAGGLSRQLRWAVLVLDLDPFAGHEQAGSRRCVVVSYEPFHGSGLMTVCPITAARATARYPNEVEIPAGEAGQTEPGLILCHQVRTVSVRRVSSLTAETALVGYLTSPALRTAVRAGLAHQLGLDVMPAADGALGAAHHH
jgi:mRNA-degrading endonuclease toxin of MazEF toxin-antitoxin module